MSVRNNGVPCLLWPFYAVWRLVIGVITLAGRLLAALLGMVLVVLGIVLSFTIIGAIVGIPMLIFGFLLIVRSLF